MKKKMESSLSKTSIESNNLLFDKNFEENASNDQKIEIIFE